VIVKKTLLAPLLLSVSQGRRTVAWKIHCSTGVRPVHSTPRFDSTVWPVATSWLAKRLNVVIANDVHIFGGKDGAPLLTISQTAELILRNHTKSDSSQRNKS
jgi:hypothetical protein